MAQMKLSVPLHIFVVFLLTSWCLASGYGKMKMKRKTEG